MILPFRIALFSLSVLFTYFFAETLEKFLLEVIRYFIVIEISNALFFNLVHITISIVPVLLFGMICSISIAGEKGLVKRMWLMLFGLMAGIILFRSYQIWWVFRGGVGEDINSWTETLSLNQLYFLEKLLPFILLGVVSSLVYSIFENESEKTLLYSLFSSLSAFIWLFITHKIQNLNGFKEIILAVFVCLICGFLTSFSIKRIKEF